MPTPSAASSYAAPDAVLTNLNFNNLYSSQNFPTLHTLSF